jgi:PAS domain S-box-containing protein
MSDVSPVRWSEVERIAALGDAAILDTPPEPAFDDIVALVKAILDTPIAIVSLVDAERQWFKARIGVEATETGLETSVCALAIRQDDLFVIEDLAADPRTATMSLVAEAPRIRFYAGFPLVTAAGLPLGSLCAIDVVPRPGGLTPEQARALRALARQVVVQIEQRSALAQRDAALVEQERRGRMLDDDADRLRMLHDAVRVGGERLELAHRAARLGSFDYVPSSGALHWDDRCRALFGVSPGAPVSYEETFAVALHPADHARVTAAVAAALDPAGSGAFEAEYRAIGIEDGVVRTLEAHGLTLFDDRVPARLIGTVQDVTEERRSRAALQEAEERLRLAVRATNDAIWDWNLIANRVQWNDALERAYGHPPAAVEPSGEWWIGHIHADDRRRVDATIHAVIAGTGSDWSAEYRFRRADGSYADVRDRGYVIRDGQGRATRMLGAMLDQSDRKAMERALESRAQTLERRVVARTRELDRLWETSPDLLVVLDFGGVVLRVNPAWTAILGYQPEELLGRHVNDLVHPDDVARTAQALADATAGPLPTVENRYRHKDGSVRWLAWVAAPTGAEIYATGRHITAQKEAAEALHQAEEQLRQAQKVEAIGQLTGGVAHDFNNLLTVIRGSVDLLRRPGLTAERQVRYIDAIADTADRAARLTSQLLAFARRSALSPEVFDAGRNVRALSEMMATLAGSLVTIKVDLAEEPCFVDADPSQFDTALINMAVNARDAMERRGELAITVRAADAIPPMRAQPGIPGAFVAVSIKDTGKGIDAARLARIFDPFYTTKAVGEGTGLGLSQVFGFAKQSGGEVKVESTVGVGSTFTLYLPRAARAPAEPLVGTESVALPISARILVVEDNPAVGAFAEQAMRELGLDTVLAQDAQEALAKLAEPGARFDYVFSDVVMPGMTGVELAKEIARLYPRLPVQLTSGYSDVLAREGAVGLNLLHKPYSVAELAAALGRLATQ